MIMHDTIAVVDNGGQFAHLIATKVRDKVKVRTVIMDPASDASEFGDVKGIILSGGPDSIHQEGSVQLNPEILEMDIPILGLCYGMHEIAIHYGGDVKGSDLKEYGFSSLNIEEDVIFKGVPQHNRAWMSHGDKVMTLPEGFKTIGSTDNCPVAAFSDIKRRRWGFQYHPEVEDTAYGMEMFRNFAVDICGASQDWTAEGNLEEITDSIVRETNGRKVLCLVSGGVDSTVVSALLHRALPKERTSFIHVDTGLMRKQESAMVEKALKEQGLTDMKTVHAQDLYLSSLEGLYEPEEKRKVIGNLFIDIINEEASIARGDEWVLAQGTLYPDTIESGGTKNSDVIKTHHNRVDVIMQMIKEGRVIEPVKDLYKAEVREVGDMMGLPHELVHRHPFPGPGLGIRALCQNESLIEENRKAVNDVQPMVDLAILEDDWAGGKVKGIVLPVLSVGVKGDARSYEHPVALWMDKDDLDWSELKLFATRLVNKTRGINRCILMLDPTVPEEPIPVVRYIDEKRMDLLREADHIVMEGLERHGLYDSIWQCPTVFIPTGYEGGETVVIRPVWSKRAMTAEVSELPDEFYDDIVPRLMALEGIDGVAVDVTSKPPGTIEWE